MDFEFADNYTTEDSARLIQGMKSGLLKRILSFLHLIKIRIVSIQP
ncbi:hypothetical protein KAU33_03145 [Candidatus Dependentiae bacterium]|nr:hypothetical protein [Candidatus Dependentiae bacterium]